MKKTDNDQICKHCPRAEFCAFSAMVGSGMGHSIKRSRYTKAIINTTSSLLKGNCEIKFRYLSCANFLAEIIESVYSGDDRVTYKICDSIRTGKNLGTIGAEIEKGNSH